MPACSNRLYTEDANAGIYINELTEKYSQGISPSPEELEKAVIEVDRDTIGGANGVYCSGMAFVSSDLPAQAELYVRRHELEHAFQFRLQMDEQNYKSAANYVAAKEYPVGMVETTVFSVIKSKRAFRLNDLLSRCALGNIQDLFPAVCRIMNSPHNWR